MALTYGFLKCKLTSVPILRSSRRKNEIQYFQAGMTHEDYHNLILNNLARRAGIKLGNGSEQVAKLWEIDGGRFDNRIRSAQLVKP